MFNIIGPNTFKSWFSLSGACRSAFSLSEVVVVFRSQNMLIWWSPWLHLLSSLSANANSCFDWTLVINFNPFINTLIGVQSLPLYYWYDLSGGWHREKCQTPLLYKISKGIEASGRATLLAPLCTEHGYSMCINSYRYLTKQAVTWEQYPMFCRYSPVSLTVRNWIENSMTSNAK